MADESEPPVEDPPAEKKFEGAEVPREPNGRVSRAKHPYVPGETIGTPEQISALTVKLAEIKAEFAGRRMKGERFKLWKQINYERTRLMRKRARHMTDRVRLRLVRARTAEKVARTAVDEAAAAVAGAASVLGRAVEEWTKFADGPLRASLEKDLLDPDSNVRKHAQDSIKDVLIAVFDIHKSAQRVSKNNTGEPVSVDWPTQGEKG